MAPEFGINCPVSWLIRVVLPAPLGPMMACSSPGTTSSERLSVATKAAEPPHQIFDAQQILSHGRTSPTGP
jgi:hypothetical protein